MHRTTKVLMVMTQLQRVRGVFEITHQKTEDILKGFFGLLQSIELLPFMENRWGKI